MSIKKRNTQVNAHKYKEVTRDYRIYRAAELDRNQVGEKTNRLVCPMVDASRSKSAYGQQSLQGLKSSDLENWAKALEISPAGMKSIAYFSGKTSSIPKNVISGSFDDKAINNGFIHALKNGVHTGILKENRFDQDRFNEFVGAFHPQLKELVLTNDWLYAEEADELYLDSSHIPQVLEYNKSHQTSKKIGLGLNLSTFEMENLLLDVLGQKIAKNSNETQAILIRDIHDLYKYGFVPAHIEEKLEAAQLLRLI